MTPQTISTDIRFTFADIVRTTAIDKIDPVNAAITILKELSSMPFDRANTIVIATVSLAPEDTPRM